MQQLQQDQDSLDALIQLTARTAAEFLGSISDRALMRPEVDYPEDLKLPEKAVGAEAALALYKSYIEPYLSASVGPRYFGFVTGGTTPAALLGDWLATSVDQNAATPGDSIAAKIEEQVINQLIELFNLNGNFSGALTTGATVSNLLGLLTARQYIGHQQNIDVAKQGMFALDVAVFSATPHASSIKSMGLAGFGQQQIVKVDCLPDSEEMDTYDLQKKLSASNAKGKIVLASAATVNTNDFDDLLSIAKICQQHNAWLHVDAAFGMFAALSPHTQDLLKGIELADSICTDGHKWLNVPYECGIFLTRHLNLLKETAGVSAPYLKTQSRYQNFTELGLENSRRFRALPMWFTLQAYGKEGYKDIVECNCRQAAQLGEWIDASDHYELFRPVKLNVVLFRAKSKGQMIDENEFNAKRLNDINKTAKVILTPGQWKGNVGMRAAFSNWRTQEKDVQILIQVLDELGK